MTNKIEHPDFKNIKQKEASLSPPPKVHQVMPPEDSEFMNKMSAVLTQQPSGAPALPPPVMDDALVKKHADRKSVLEKLVLFKQPHYHEVSLGGVDFRLKLLNADDNSKVYMMIRDLPDNEQLTRSPIIMLAAALVDANGLKIEDTYDGPEIDDPMVKKYHELCKWNMPVINALVSSFSRFSNKVEEGYSESFLEKSQTTPSTD